MQHTQFTYSITITYTINTISQHTQAAQLSNKRLLTEKKLLIINVGKTDVRQAPVVVLYSGYVYVYILKSYLTHTIFASLQYVHTSTVILGCVTFHIIRQNNTLHLLNMNINYFEGLMCVNYSLDDHEQYCSRSCKVHFSS